MLVEDTRTQVVRLSRKALSRPDGASKRVRLPATAGQAGGTGYSLEISAMAPNWVPS